ncbi:prephenate dehydrogenase [Demequina capsici]|uniref:Prephenate dehydrogenase n=1 Tax=Demequina capsici TaxID=3075620 RepID=A0AA96FCP3_9MICO|nr:MULTISPECIES: prephenate dehydrogenase [unclassified Demequina]WNM25910.1 prephenate dehydrogenase [Demequina sp. OYTSA14]WNM28811.1 prephenate dehydrogenase [Demequina sp. PMTSA13]
MDATPRTHIIGAGLIGASIGLGLRAAGWTTTIADVSANAERLAWDIGAGMPLGDDAPELVIVAVRPSDTGDVVAKALATWPGALVTDVASVKAPVLDAARAVGAADRYVGSHPMSGREVSGGLAAQSDLFSARPWVICQGEAPRSAVAVVASVAQALESDVVEMEASAHDAAVARVSHAPQVVASAAAAALGPLGADDVALAGQGLRDVTRIAGSPPAMWADIARLNRHAIVATLDHIIGDLEDVREADDIGEALTDLIARGNLEVARIPGKHGGRTREWRGVTVIVPDTPGQLVRLLTDAASVGANVEDLSIEHSPRQPVGLTTLYVEPASAPPLVEALERAGWTVAAS